MFIEPWTSIYLNDNYLVKDEQFMFEQNLEFFFKTQRFGFVCFLIFEQTFDKPIRFNKSNACTVLGNWVLNTL